MHKSSSVSPQKLRRCISEAARLPDSEWSSKALGRAGGELLFNLLVDVEPTWEHICKLAGEAIANMPEATVVDAIVMASAAQRGDVVYTSDFEDLDRLHTHFRGVHKVLRV